MLERPDCAHGVTVRRPFRPISRRRTSTAMLGPAMGQASKKCRQTWWTQSSTRPLNSISTPC